MPSTSLMSALSCLTSGTIVEFSIETAYDVLGFKQTSRSATQNRSERERYLSPVGARGCSDRSHLVPSHASDRSSPTAAVVPPSLAPPNCLSTILTSPMPAAQRFGTWADQDGSLSRSTDAVLWESAISVLPLGALSASLLEIRIPASTLRVEQPLLCMVRPQGRRMRHADRRSAKSILAEQRAVRQGGSETVGRERGKRQAQAFQFSTPIHTATCSPHLVP